MKQLFSIVAIAVCVLSAANANATVWRVNNNPGTNATFKSVQKANDSAAVKNGDTLHIEPSVNDYGNLSLTKRLVLIGTGYFLAENGGLQANSAVTSRIYNLTIANTAASNSVIMLNVSHNLYIQNGVSGVNIKRAYIYYLNGDNASNTIVLNSYLGSCSFDNSSQVIITNCIVSDALYISYRASATVTNNVLNATSGGTIEISNTLFQNNIINKQPYFYIPNNSTIQNNLAPNNILTNTGSNTGNKNNVNMTTVFVNPNSTVDNGFVLLTGANNPARNAGTDGKDCGAFGGSGVPFKLGLQPPVPAIYKFQAPASVSGNTLTFTFSTRGNN